MKNTLNNFQQFLPYVVKNVFLLCFVFKVFSKISPKSPNLVAQLAGN